jgi:adenylosuccinate synthase
VLPYHKLVDAESAASKAIGTTGRGIGPAYEDKIARRGVRVLDLRHPTGCARSWRRAPSTRTRSSRLRLAAARGRGGDARLLARLAPRLLPLAEDVGLCIHRALRTGAAVLLEGRAGLAARRRPRHLPVRDVEQHDVGRGGDRARASRRRRSTRCSAW